MDQKIDQKYDLAERVSASAVDPKFVTEVVKLEVTEKIVDLLEGQSLSRTQFAERLARTPGYVTKLLSGANNFTLETLVRVGMALGQMLSVSFVPETTKLASNWVSHPEHLRLAKDKSKSGPAGGPALFSKPLSWGQSSQHLPIRDGPGSRLLAYLSDQPARDCFLTSLPV